MTKEEISTVVLNELKSLGLPEFSQITVDDVLLNWWTTGRIGSGLRLTKTGYNAFSLANIEGQTFDAMFLVKLKYREYVHFMVKCDKKLSCPYFYFFDKDKKKSHFIVYNQKIAMVIGLYGGIDGYINK